MGFYAFVEATESTEWQRVLEPGESLMTFVPSSPAVPQWFLLVVALCAIVGALALVAIAVRPSPGRFIAISGEPVMLDTQTGTVCRFAHIGERPICHATP